MIPQIHITIKTFIVMVWQSYIISAETKANKDILNPALLW